MTARSLPPDLVRAVHLHREGAGAAAETLYRKVLRAHPRHPLALAGLGRLLLETGQLDPAVLMLRRALAARRDFPEACHDLAEALRRQGRYAEAARAFSDAYDLYPEESRARVSVLVGRGRCLGALGELAAALESYAEALRRDPSTLDAVMGISGILYDQGRQAEAIAGFRAVIAARPDDVEAHYQLGVALLRQGEYAEGWAEHEWRRRKPAYPVYRFGRPEWDGGRRDGATVLFYGEQGLGDVLQFARFATQAAERGVRPLLAVPGPLCRLLATVPGVAATVPYGVDLPAFDAHLPLMSLPWRLGLSVDQVGLDRPCFTADPAAAAVWAGRLAPLRPPRGLLAGLVWAGAPRPDLLDAALVDRRRSIALDRFAPLAAIPGLRLVSLQKGPPQAQIASCPDLGLIDPMDEIADFADTAALVSALDLVISVDTSVAHLAGGLGKDVWLLNRFDGDWRWGLDGDRSPWYPSARVFREPAPESWDAVIAEIAEKLRRRLDASAFIPGGGR